MTGQEVFEEIFRQQAQTAVMMCGVVRPATIADRFRNIMSGVYQALILSGQIGEDPRYTAKYLELARIIEETAGNKEALLQHIG